MKQYFIKPALAAGLVLLALPSVCFAQQQDATTKEKDSAKKGETQQIIITRSGDAAEKTVVEIKGNNVFINGKEAKDGRNENVSVQTHTWPDFNNNFNFDLNHDLNFNLNNDLNSGRVSLFSEDANRAMLGVMTDEDDDGAKITSITKESSAEKAGLKVGDVITKIGDEEIDDADDVSKAVRRHKPGDKVVVHFSRNGKKQTITAELGKWKGIRINNLNATFAPMVPTPPAAPTPPGTFRSFAYSYGSSPKLGLSVQDTDDSKGVKVLAVAEESNAAKAGVKKDDIITHINDEEVTSTDHVKGMMREAINGASVKLQLLRDGKKQTIDVRIPRKLKTADL